jgi:S-adenosylmethionine synthetase
VRRHGVVASKDNRWIFAMRSIRISAQTIDDSVEIVERKGLGHPDTICDALAENLSRNLCREYRRRFGRILHHNVDKALLCGGRAEPAFGGGTILAPINVYLAGRAVTEVGGEAVAVEDIAIASSHAWLLANLHALGQEHGLQLHTLIQPGSQDLRDLFSRRTQGEIPVANDTSIGVGHAPLSPLERLVLTIERSINARDRSRINPAWGEDVKVMGIRQSNAVQLTVACAMIGRYLRHIDDYLAEKRTIENLARELAAQHGFSSCEIAINAADHPSAGTVYLTVTGTSAEAGDDGEVGRGNRVNGLITPCRPMSLEAAAGKNPVTHVGKIYNVLAFEISKALVATVPEIASAQCLMVSQIGKPVTEPAALQIGIATRDRFPIAELKCKVDEIAADNMNHIPDLIDHFVDGKIDIF